MEPMKITIDTAKLALDHGPQPVFIDSRNPKAWDSSREKLPGAIRIPVDEVDQHLQEIPVDRPLVTHCT